MIKNIGNVLCVRKSIFVGIIVLLPFFIVGFILNLATGFLNPIWKPIFEIGNINRFTEKGFGFAELAASLLVVFIIGRILISKNIRSGFWGKLIRSIPLVGFFYKIAFQVVYTLEDLQSFPVVMVEQFDGNYIFGFAVGIQKQRRKALDGIRARKLLRVYYPDFPAQFNGRGGMIEFRRAERVLNPLSDCIPLFTTAYIAAPNWLETEPWSSKFSEELENLQNGTSTDDEIYHLKDIMSLPKIIFKLILEKGKQLISRR